MQIIGSEPPVTTAGPGVEASSGGIPGYAWVIIAVIAVALIIGVVLVLVIVLTRRNRKPKYVTSCLSQTISDHTSPFLHLLYRPPSHERMYDEQQLEETQSAHSIGVVENPLYVEEEGAFSCQEVIL